MKQNLKTGRTGISREAKEKMRLRKLGNQYFLKQEMLMIASSIRPIIKLSMTGEFIKEFPSLKEAAESVGKKYNNLIACAKGEQNSCWWF